MKKPREDFGACGADPKEDSDRDGDGEVDRDAMLTVQQGDASTGERLTQLRCQRRVEEVAKGETLKILKIPLIGPCTPHSRFEAAEYTGRLYRRYSEHLQLEDWGV